MSNVSTEVMRMPETGRDSHERGGCGDALIVAGREPPAPSSRGPARRGSALAHRSVRKSVALRQRALDLDAVALPAQEAPARRCWARPPPSGAARGEAHRASTDGRKGGPTGWSVVRPPVSLPDLLQRETGPGRC